MPVFKSITFAASLSFAAFAFAAEPAAPRYNAVEFQVEVQREVPNDLLNATLYVELNDANPATLANAVNQRVNEALRVAKEHKGVRVRSGNNQSYPVYGSNNTLRGWRARAEVRVESRDIPAASALIGKLQSGMQLAGIQFSVSPESRRAVEDELTVEAIAAFKARAEVVRNALAGRGYKIQRLGVASGHNAPQPRVAMARAAMSSPEVTPPNLEGGTSQITVTASGTIEVIEK